MAENERGMHEVRVAPLDDDPAGRDIAAEVNRVFGEGSVDAVHVETVYRLEGVTAEETQVVADRLVTDPVTQHSIVNGPRNTDPLTVERVYKPGVTILGVASLKRASGDRGVNPVAASISERFTFSGDGVTPEFVQAATQRLLVNDTIQQVLKSVPETLVVTDEARAIQTVPICEVSDEDLMSLSEDKLFLNLEEMKVIQTHFRKLGREPKDAELEVLAARWSEHCGHKTFNAKIMYRNPDGSLTEKDPFFTRIKRNARANFGDLVVSAFDDNSGVIKFFDGMAVCGKVETHNKPSSLEPYAGSMTGSGGVFRDIMGTGQGAKTILSTDMFCFAPLDYNASSLPPNVHPSDYIQRRTTAGVRDYGNRMGIPTMNGSFHYHEGFRASPSVIVGAYGILPEERAQKGTPQVGDLVVVIGGATGRDGIHGATFSSGDSTERTAVVNSSAVQVGDAIEEKRTADALLLARDLGYIQALTDCGAAGFSSAIGEMGEATGVTVDIADAPVKYQGLEPWEVWMSESQERMVAAIAPEHIEAFLKLCATNNAEAKVLGKFDGTMTLTVNYGDENLVELDYDFLTKGLPQRVMIADWRPPEIDEIRPEAPVDAVEWIARYKAVLAHGNVCSKEPVVRQYDHGVQGGAVVVPFGGQDQSTPNDAAVVRPILGKPYGFVESHGKNPALSTINPAEAARWVVAEAVANYIAVGGDASHAGFVGNYIGPSPDDEVMGAIDMMVDASDDMYNQLGIPLVSGKDSLSSTYRGGGEVIKIPPYYVSSLFGGIPDVEKTVTADVKAPGKSKFYLIGRPSYGMGGSTYYDVTGGSSAEMAEVDIPDLRHTIHVIDELIQSGTALACHDVSEGGLATTIAEMCFSNGAGAELNVAPWTDPEDFLFTESAGCLVVEVPEDVDLYFSPEEATMVEIGRTTTDGTIRLNQVDFHDTTTLFAVRTDDLKQAWQQPMKELYHG